MNGSIESRLHGWPVANSRTDACDLGETVRIGGVKRPVRAIVGPPQGRPGHVVSADHPAADAGADIATWAKRGFRRGEMLRLMGRLASAARVTMKY